MADIDTLSAADVPTMPSGRRFGVAILANDRVYPWLLPFLESFATHNPTLPLHLIPFDDRMDKVARAAAVYGVPIVDADLSDIDRFAASIYPQFPVRRRRLRKLQCLRLDLDEVLYIDVDTVALRDFSPLFGHVVPGSADFVIASTSPGWVYNGRRSRYDFLAHAMPFSDGFFITSSRTLSLPAMMDAVSNNIDVFWKVRKNRVYCQPVVNFALHRIGTAITTIADCMPTASTESFYKAKGIRFQADGPIDPYGRHIYFAHWAGASWFSRTAPFDHLWRDFSARATARLADAPPGDRTG